MASSLRVLVRVVPVVTTASQRCGEARGVTYSVTHSVTEGDPKRPKEYCVALPCISGDSRMASIIAVCITSHTYSLSQSFIQFHSVCTHIGRVCVRNARTRPTDVGLVLHM